MIILAQQIILLLGTLISGIADAKTGYIYDYITYPMIILGIIFSSFQGYWFNISSGAIIFVILFITYKLGKIGGGDVKLFTGIALLNPFNNLEFIMSLFLISALSAMLFYSIYYSTKCILKKGFENVKKESILKGTGIIIFTIIYLIYMYFNNFINEIFLFLMGIPLLAIGVYMIFQENIEQEFFEKKVKINNLDEDEILSKNNSEKIFKLTNNKTFIEENEIKILKKNKIKNLIVMRNLPKFGPFIFIGTIFAIYLPELIFLIF